MSGDYVCATNLWIGLCFKRKKFIHLPVRGLKLDPSMIHSSRRSMYPALVRRDETFWLLTRATTLLHSEHPSPGFPPVSGCRSIFNKWEFKQATQKISTHKAEASYSLQHRSAANWNCDRMFSLCQKKRMEVLPSPCWRRARHPAASRRCENNANGCCFSLAAPLQCWKLFPQSLHNTLHANYIDIKAVERIKSAPPGMAVSWSSEAL